MTRTHLIVWLCGWAVALPTVARAQHEIPVSGEFVNVSLDESVPYHRYVAIELNPAPALLGRYGGNIILTPVAHHALVITPFYIRDTTAPVYTGMDANSENGAPLTEKTFDGWGGELGYRYYADRGGPRGLFVGPSLITSWLRQHVAGEPDVSFRNYGAAIDVGYSALVAGRVSLSLGVGAQYMLMRPNLPMQLYPAKLVVNAAVLPRLLFSLGVAL